MKEIFLDNKEKNTCNGCGVCSLVCPVKAIEMKEDGEGFLYPEIDRNKCVNCNKCRKVCSNTVSQNNYSIKAYATKNKNDIERKNSTSGGMFKILSKYIIEKNGVIFGVKFNKNMKAVHDYAENLEECKEFSYSKYVRSDLNNSYKKVKKFLEEGRFVLFTGTPCQVQGLRNFLGKDNKKLILCEIVCHANPSPKVLEMYLKNHEIKSGKKIKNIYFRSKDIEMNNGPYIEFEDNTKLQESLYNKAFTVEQLINRPSCHNCKFVDENRKADFTIGDFWGVEKIFPDFSDKDGISLLTVNTKKASEVFEEIKEKMYYRETTLELAFRNNHNCNMPISKNRDRFFKGIEENRINENNIIEYMYKYTKESIYLKIKRKIKRIFAK